MPAVRADAQPRALDIVKSVVDPGAAWLEAVGRTLALDQAFEGLEPGDALEVCLDGATTPVISLRALTPNRCQVALRDDASLGLSAIDGATELELLFEGRAQARGALHAGLRSVVARRAGHRLQTVAPFAVAKLLPPDEEREALSPWLTSVGFNAHAALALKERLSRVTALPPGGRLRVDLSNRLLEVRAPPRVDGASPTKGFVEVVRAYSMGVASVTEDWLGTPARSLAKVLGRISKEQRWLELGLTLENATVQVKVPLSMSAPWPAQAVALAAEGQLSGALRSLGAAVSADAVYEPSTVSPLSASEGESVLGFPVTLSLATRVRRGANLPRSEVRTTAPEVARWLDARL